MQITKTQRQSTTEEWEGHMNNQSFEKSVSTIGAAVLVQFAIKWCVIAFLGWLAVSSVDTWLTIIFK